jgi:hypothetical protein
LIRRACSAAWAANEEGSICVLELDQEEEFRVGRHFLKGKSGWEKAGGAIDLACVSHECREIVVGYGRIVVPHRVVGPAVEWDGVGIAAFVQGREESFKGLAGEFVVQGRE